MGLADGMAWEKEFRTEENNMRNVLKKNTRYEIESVEQLKEILEVAKKEGYGSSILVEDFESVYYLYIHKFSVGWDKESTKPYYNYPLVTWKGIEPQPETSVEPSVKYPTEDFKISLKDMSEAEKSATKNWIRDVAIHRGFQHKNLVWKANFYWVTCRYDGGMVDYSHNEEYFQKDETPELTLTFETTVTGFNYPDKKNKKELQLEELLSKLTKQLEETQSELTKIKEGE